MENENKNEVRNSIILRTYSRAWNYEKKVYSFGDMRLPVAVNLTQMGYFFIGLIIAFLMSKIPIIEEIPVLLRYLLLPFTIMKFLTNFKHDGKLPLKWIKDWFKYLKEPKIIIRGEKVEEYEQMSFTDCRRI